MKTFKIVFFIIFGLFIESCQTNFFIGLKRDNKEYPYIFEGEVLEINIFPCDKTGIKIPLENAIWEQNVGKFKLKDGSEALGLTETNIAIRKIYKGKLKEKTIIIESYSLELSVHLELTKKGQVLKSNYTPRSHGSLPMILPRQNIGYRSIFYCKESFSGLENRVSLGSK